MGNIPLGLYFTAQEHYKLISHNIKTASLTLY